MQQTGAAIAAFTLLILAVVFQVPEFRNMATHKAQYLLRQSAPYVNVLRGVLPYYKNSPSATLSSPSSATPNIQQTHTTSQRQLTTTASTMADSTSLLSTMELRRSYHQLLNESTISDARITELVTHTIKHVPSAFNSQTTRMVVVLKEKHEELWDAVMEIYKVSLPPDKFEQAKGRMVGFRKAYGTVSSE